MMRTKLSTCVLLLATACHLHAAGLPASGTSMRAVEQEFGAPLKKNAPVGQPPITRWEYNGFVVVFERSTVVQSVEIIGKNTAAPAPAPSPAPVSTPAPVASPAAAPVAAKPEAVQSNIAEIERQTKEREAMAMAAAEKEKAEAEAAAKAAAVPAPAAPVVTAPVVPAPVVAAPVAPAPAVTAPVDPVKVTPAAPEPAPEPKKPKGDGSYTFDPATGRIIIN